MEAVNPARQQLYDSISPNSDNYYSSVARDGSGSFSTVTGSAHYSEVSFHEDNPDGDQPASADPVRRPLKTFPQHSRVLPRDRPTHSATQQTGNARTIDQSQQIYANVSVEVEAAFQRGAYEFDESVHTQISEARNSLDTSQMPLVMPHLYSYACVGRPEVSGYCMLPLLGW